MKKPLAKRIAKLVKSKDAIVKELLMIEHDLKEERDILFTALKEAATKAEENPGNKKLAKEYRDIAVCYNRVSREYNAIGDYTSVLTKVDKRLLPDIVQDHMI